MKLSEFPPFDECAIFGKEMRNVAMSHPCLSSDDCGLPMYQRMMGEKYHVNLTLELFKNPPQWHGSVCVLHEVGSGTPQTFGAPDTAILAVPEWPNEEIKNATEIFGYVLGPLIKKMADIQPVAGMFSLHVFVPAAVLPILNVEGRA